MKLDTTFPKFVGSGGILYW